MKKFRVNVVKEWKEFGSAVLYADSEEEAREFALDMLVDGSEEITWSTDMDPGNHDVDSVEELE